jgi:hypothetical protein
MQQPFYFFELRRHKSRQGKSCTQSLQKKTIIIASPPIYCNMANTTYDSLWQEAIGELGEQLHVEGADDGEEEGGGNSVSSSS